MGKSHRHNLQSNLFAALFWALGIVLATTWPSPPACHRWTAVQAACPCMLCSHCRYRGGGWVQLSKKPHYFAHLALINLWTYIWYYSLDFLNTDRQTAIPLPKAWKAPSAGPTFRPAPAAPPTFRPAQAAPPSAAATDEQQPVRVRILLLVYKNETCREPFTE